MNKQYTYNSPSVQKMLNTVNKYMALSKWKENNYELTIDKKNNECKMNNRFLINKIENCEDCPYNHICEEKGE